MKVFFTYEEQIEKLKKDGLIVQNETEAVENLKNEGYYNIINGYASAFKREKGFLKGITFENILSLYNFDKSLSISIYKYTSIIETRIKALIAHEFSRCHGVDDTKYLTKECFTNSKNSIQNVEKLIEECKKTIECGKNKGSNKFRQYIEHNYTVHGHVPLWVLIRAITFGATSIFYKNMKKEEQTKISNEFRLLPTELTNILEVVVAFRNIVAHGERLYCARLPKTRLSTALTITKKLSIEKKKNGENKYGRNDFLALLICCKYLLKPMEYASLYFELIQCFNILEKDLSQNLVAKIKTAMGLKTNSWKILPKLKI